MKVEQFMDLMDNPNLLEEVHIPVIEKIIADYPYFQTAHLLYAKALNNVKHINHHVALKRTAVVAGNRAVLYRLINNQGTRDERQETRGEEREQLAVSNEQKPVIIEAEKLEKTISPVNITYTIINSEQVVVSSEQPPIFKSEVIEARSKIQDTAHNKETETLDEIILKPIVEAYVETEILKLTEKEPEVNIDEPRSFTDWLKQVSSIRYQVLGNNEVQETRDKRQETRIKTNKQVLLDKLLKEEMRISKPQADKNFYAASQKTRSSVLEDENLVTETLAKIYVLQGNPAKAIRAYEILSLKFPEKSAYFAALIKELKNNIK